MAVSYADRQALAVLAPTVTRELQISESAYGWLLSAFSLAYLVGAPLAGRWIDRVGARRGLPIAVGIWSLIAGLHVLLPGPGAGLWALLLLRVALGFAESPSFPGASQTIHRALPPAERPRGFGVLYVGSSLGAMVVPPLATSLHARYGFRVAFLGVAAVGLIWLPLWWLATRFPQARAQLDQPPGDEPEPTLPLRQLLGLPAVRRGLAATLAVSPMMSYTLNWSAKYLVATFGISQAEVGKLLWLPPLLFDLGSVGFGLRYAASLKRHAGRVTPAPLKLGLAALGLAGVSALVPAGTTTLQAVLLVGVAMAGGGALFALFTADTLARVPSGSVSSVAGILASGQSLAYIAASPLIGQGVQSHGHPTVLWALAAWLVPGVMAWLLIRQRTPPETQ